MDRTTEQIAINWLAAARRETESAGLINQVEDFCDEELDRVFKEHHKLRKEEYEKANAEFWLAFKYPLQVFDLKKGENPNLDETVFGYDEQEGTWFSVYISIGSIAFENNRFNWLVEEMHRWVRMPILEDE